VYNAARIEAQYSLALRLRDEHVTHPVSQTVQSSGQTPDGLKSKAWILPFSLLLLVISVDSIDVNSFGPVMAQIKSAWNMSNTNVGIYTGMYGLLSILVAVPIGESVRRWGVKRSVMGAATIIFLGMMLMATANAFSQGLTGRILAAGGIRMATVASWAGATTVAPASIMTSAWTIMNTANAAGGIIGPSLVGGYIGSNFGWRAVFFSLAGFSVFCLIIIGLFLRMPLAKTAPPDSIAASKDASRFNVYRCWDIYLMGIIFTLMIGGSQISIMSFAPLAMVQRWKMDPQAIGNIMGLSYAVGLPVMFAAGILADKFRTRKKILIATAVPMAAGLFMLTSQSQTVFVAGMICYLGFTYAPGAMLYASAPGLVPKGTNLGPVYGLLVTISNAGAFFAPIIVGRIRDATGDLNPSFILLGTLCTLSLFLCFRLKIR
jgi:predicted MFS family arabinose efflux permease